MNFDTELKKLNELNISDVIKGIMTPGAGREEEPNRVENKPEPIQPTDGTGQCGCNQGATVQNIKISKTEEGDIKITTDNICVKLSPIIVDALIKFKETQNEG